MDYSNPDIPEGINYSKTHPLKEFAILTAGVFGVLLIMVLVLGFFADHLAQFIPYRIEKNFHLLVPAKDDGPPALKAYLDDMTKRIATAEDLPDEMKITVHYVDSDIVNAYATVGGHVVLYRGLLEKLRHENALVMVMAHEIAHVKHRHVIRSLGSGLVVGIALSMLNTSLSNSVVSNMIDQTGQIGILKFSRTFEQQADDAALDSLQRMYGQVAGAEELFAAIKAEEKLGFAPVFLRTHPDTEARICHIREILQQHGQSNVKLVPLPGDFKTWLTTDVAADKKHSDG